MRKLMSLAVLVCFFSAVVAQPAMTEDAAETPVVPSKLVTVYQVTLDQPITLPQCTEQMYWYQNGNEMCLHMDKFHYQGVLAYSGTDSLS